MRPSSTAATGAARRISIRAATNALANAMTRTEAIASEGEDHVEPHNKANCTMDFVSRSMKPAPRKKKRRDRAVGADAARVSGETARTDIADTSSTMPS